MRILLTGASGLVGGAFAQAAAARGHEVLGVVGRFTGELPGVARRLVWDLAAPDGLDETIAREQPAAIVNCAAVSEPAMCDADPVRSEALNVALPTRLAQVAARLAARCLHLSSEQAFDGARCRPYAVNDTPSPINLYSRQKVASEAAVLAAAPALAAVVRAPLLMGNSPGGRRSLHERLLADWAAGRAARLYTDEFRQPCTAENLAAALVELVEQRALCGVFHWAGAEVLSRHELGLRVRTHFQLPAGAAPIVAVTRADNPEVSRQRQASLALNLAPLLTALATRPQTLAAQLPTLRVPAACRAWLETAAVPPAAAAANPAAR